MYPLGEKKLHIRLYLTSFSPPAVKNENRVYFSLEQVHYNLTSLKAKLEDYTSERRNFFLFV